MADVVRDILIRILGEDSTGPALSSFSSGLKDVTNNISSVTQPIEQFAQQLLKVEAAVVTAGGALATYASIKASEFESAQSNLNKVLSDSDPQVQTFTKTVFELSEQYGVSSAVVLEGISNFKQAGFTAEEAAILQKNALDLMIAGDIEGAEASAYLVQTIKGFGAEASDASRFIEALNNVSNEYATDVEQLAEGVSRVAPIMELMGFSFEETTGLLTPMIEVFGSGQFAAEALKTGMLRLVDDSAPIKDALSSIGVAQTDLNGEMRSGKDIFYDVAEAFGSVDENQKLVLAGQLFGIDQAPRLVAVFNDLAKVNEVTATAMQSTGSVTNEVNSRLETTEKQLDKSKAAFDNLSIVIGEKFNTSLKGVSGASDDVFLAMRKIVEDGGLDTFFDFIEPYFKNFEDTLTNVAENLPEAFKAVDGSGLYESIKAISDNIKAVFGEVDLNTTEGLTRAIQSIVDAFTNLNTFTAQVIETLTPLFQTFADLATRSGESGNEMSNVAGRIAGLSIEFNALKPLIEPITSLFGGLGGALTALSWTTTANGAVNLATNLSRLAPALTALTGPFGAIAALLASGALIWDDYQKSVEFNEKTQADIALQVQNASKALEDQNGIFAKITESTGLVVTSWDDVAEAVDNGVLSYNAANDTYSLTKTGLDDLGVTLNGVKIGSEELAEAVQKGDIVWNEASGKYILATENAHALAKATFEAGGGLGELNGAGENSTKVFSEIVSNYQNATNGASKYLTVIDGVTLTENQLNAAIDQGLVIWDGVNQKWAASSIAVDLNNQQIQTAISKNDLLAQTLLILDPSIGDTKRSFDDYSDALLVANNLTDQGRAATVEYVDGLYVVLETNNKNTKAHEETKKAVEDTTAANVRGSEEWARTAAAMNDATKIANDFTIAAQEIAGKRYEAVVTAVVDLKVADIEAQTARIEASFESLNTGIESTGETLTGLVDSFVSLGALGAGDAYEFIKGLIEDENARRQQEFDLQSKLVNAQVQYMEAQTVRLTSGEALIQIDGTELVPELELVLTKIVELAHIKASEFANSFLIGIS